MEREESEKLLKAFRKESSRHVLVIEADMAEDDRRNVFSISNRLRLAGNELVATMRKNIAQLLRTKRYRKLKALYGKAVENSDKALKSHLSAQMKVMLDDHGVSWDYCRRAMIPIGKKYHLPSVFALTRAEDIWKGVGGMTFSPIVSDRFEEEEVLAMLSYLLNPDSADENAVNLFNESGTIMDTYRPCYASLKCEEIRGRLRVLIHLTIEGKAKSKFSREGSPRHKYGTGVVGCDIGTQTIAYTSASECGLTNLAERGNAIATSEREERLLLRKMDRSRRATNPDNYNEDGTVKKGPKKWRCSKNYIKDKQRLKALRRKNSINRHLAMK